MIRGVRRDRPAPTLEPCAVAGAAGAAAAGIPLSRTRSLYVPSRPCTALPRSLYGPHNPFRAPCTALLVPSARRRDVVTRAVQPVRTEKCVSLTTLLINTAAPRRPSLRRRHPAGRRVPLRRRCRQHRRPLSSYRYRIVHRVTPNWSDQYPRRDASVRYYTPVCIHVSETGPGLFK